MRSLINFIRDIIFIGQNIHCIKYIRGKYLYKLRNVQKFAKYELFKNFQISHAHDILKVFNLYHNILNYYKQKIEQTENKSNKKYD